MIVTATLSPGTAVDRPEPSSPKVNLRIGDVSVPIPASTGSSPVMVGTLSSTMAVSDPIAVVWFVSKKVTVRVSPSCTQIAPSEAEEAAPALELRGTEPW